ncbi:MAG: HD-GYP domain-containing protein [Clostridiales bacterium]|jgi:putative nucleotidyltransferase with HDIG domain|nr:HD-GYP domain-containing protein [Clostridiales bacterium]
MARIIEMIAVDDLFDGMIADDDVYNRYSILLVSNGSILTADKIDLLKRNGVRSINVRIPVTSVTEREDFQQFSAHYNESVEAASEAIKNISDGGLIDMEQLYAVTDGIVGNLRIKSDIFTYMGFLKDHDDYTFSHSSNVALLANVFARWMKFSEADVRDITIAGMLHDIGKTKVPLEILNKPSKLTDEEYRIIKLHSINGYTLLKDHDIPSRIKLAALNHHERINGEGYPRKLKGDKIDDFSKIIAICDVYDAMTANRCYRGKICPFDVIAKLESSSYGEMDTKYLLAFLKHVVYNYLNSWVMLSSDEEAEIMFINPASLTRPIVRAKGRVVNLAEERDIKITAIL